MPRSLSAVHGLPAPGADDGAAAGPVGGLPTGIQPVGRARERSGYVRTPDELADELCAAPHHDLRWLAAGARVLEPSAGDGALVAAILRTNPAMTVTAVEPDPVRAQLCADRHPGPDSPVAVYATTFEQYTVAAARAGLRFDAVVMNPPFAVTGQADVWWEHLRAAWHLLRPGGRLVCVVPAGFAFRSSGIAADARAFVEHHGTHLPLPADAFTPSGIQVATRLVRMTKPVAVGGREYLLAPDRHREPVPVEAPRLTGAAAMTTPAQRIDGGWHRDRVVRFHGRCVICGWLLWGFDDGQNDPRGPLGPFSAGFSLTAHDYDRSGPTIGLCVDCANTGDSYRRAREQAYQHWTTIPARCA